jgi:hypothetical protein
MGCRSRADKLRRNDSGAALRLGAALALCRSFCERTTLSPAETWFCEPLGEWRRIRDSNS